MISPFAELRLTDPSTLFLLLLIVATGFLLMRASRHFARQQREAGPLEPGRPRREDSGQPTLDKPELLNRWTVEMHETARALSAQLDSKIRVLAALVAEADRAASRLETAMAQAGQTARPADTQAQCRQGAAGNAREEERRGKQVSEVNTTATQASDEPLISTPRTLHRDEVYTLADYGLAPAEIAQRVGCPVGEVELFLSLRGTG
jgi:hypothetical protein